MRRLTTSSLIVQHLAVNLLATTLSTSPKQPSLRNRSANNPSAALQKCLFEQCAQVTLDENQRRRAVQRPPFNTSSLKNRKEDPYVSRY